MKRKSLPFSNQPSSYHSTTLLPFAARLFKIYVSIHISNSFTSVLITFSNLAFILILTQRWPWPCAAQCPGLDGLSARPLCPPVDKFSSLCTTTSYTPLILSYCTDNPFSFLSKLYHGCISILISLVSFTSWLGESIPGVKYHLNYEKFKKYSFIPNLPYIVKSCNSKCLLIFIIGCLIYQSQHFQYLIPIFPQTSFSSYFSYLKTCAFLINATTITLS